MRTSTASTIVLIVISIIAANPSASPAQIEDDPPISIGDSSVGYVDNAVPGDIVRLRMDLAYGINRANRAEFLWAWLPPSGPGPELDESSVDYQRMSVYLEKEFSPCLSLFVDLPAVLSNPEVNDNAGGLSDIQAGVKWAFQRSCDQVASFQLRAYAPSGDADRGLGVGHASIEPALLLHRRLPDRWNFDGELRYWIPIDGTPDRQGPVVRYGVGVSRSFGCDCRYRLTPVVEAVGWTVVDGAARFLNEAMVPVTEDSGGDTIVNLKAGARFGFNTRSDVYAGYGRSLTGHRWYQDIFRIEWRYTY